ncbi:CRISPR-associated helicase Cas3 [Sulfobacillus acidophilus TPY]|uniref:CRISPR-associated HD domain protein n=1 Tax=Sulfobacillus acidophilus (strain ATCC 700253 / DSM 10332 / NAL) TaxID=679936 RepID=G8TT45_SULAD|nr:CRISPR-associated helicase Cas3 [Sulfobacillus acidophilus TPY]AEW06745.1 CRISPR-associated HD domain protein [Sulfobacillus acidophilus DSM 10332]
MPKLSECIARPRQGDREFLLTDHLSTVGHWASRRLTGHDRDYLLLAGLLHDLGKASLSWQQYIRQNAPGVHHAFLGSAVYFYLVSRQSLKDAERRTVMWITRDLAHHHAPLGDIERTPPWIAGWEPAAIYEVNWVDVREFLSQHVPDYAAFLPADPARLDGELRRLSRTWQQWWLNLPPLSTPDEFRLQIQRAYTSRLIQADRFDAANIEEDPGISPQAARQALDKIEVHLSTRDQIGSSVIQAYREEAQDFVLNQLALQGSRMLTILQMPTGSGKTLTAIRHALQVISEGRANRLIYVAPYLSIVDQTASILRDITGLSVMVHHHLSLPDHPSDMREQPEGVLLALESWQSPIVVTTFNQLFRAIFPYTAQQSIRLAALERTVLIIDEPQIIDVTVWNAFLFGLEATCRSMDASALIMSATVPPVTHAQLPEPPAMIVAPPLPPTLIRYVVNVADDPWTVERVVEEGRNAIVEGFPSVVIMVNTVGDVARIYHAWELQYPDCSWTVLTLHGAMHGLHKAYQLRIIREKVNKGEPFCVIATQTLEAGVDISFARMFRARPILPSIVQAAGRLNRHHEKGDPGRITVFDLIRDDGRDSRGMVYRDAIMREETDRVLRPGIQYDEIDMNKWIEDYYQTVFERNHYSAVMDKVRKAANGQWSQLAGLEPFYSVYDREPLFVPVAGDAENPTLWLDDDTRNLLGSFSVTLDTLYERWRDPKTYRSLSFTNRKRFLSLVERFVTSVPYRVGRALSDMDPLVAIQKIADPHNYSVDLGLAGWFLHEAREETVIW